MMPQTVLLLAAFLPAVAGFRTMVRLRSIRSRSTLMSAEEEDIIDKSFDLSTQRVSANLSVSAAFSSVVAESPLLRQYLVAKAAKEARKQGSGVINDNADLYRAWQQRVASEQEVNARLTPMERDFRDRVLAEKLAAEAEEARARVAAVERAIGNVRAINDFLWWTVVYPFKKQAGRLPCGDERD